MSLYIKYLNEIEDRKKDGLQPKPIDSADLLKEIIALIKENNIDKKSARFSHL